MKTILAPTGLSVNSYNPKFGVMKNYFIEDLTDKITGLSFEKLAMGGDWSADISMNGSFVMAEDWLSNGLGRRICIVGHQGVPVWDGFVNKITVSIGGLQHSSGAIEEIGNRVSVQYTPIDYSVYPPVSGTSTFTLITEDTGSQEKFGVIEKMYSGGSITDAEAIEVRDVYLTENSYPASTGDLNLSDSAASELQISLECMGWVHWFRFYIYDDFTSGAVSLYTKLMSVIAADPNGIFSLDRSNIKDNLLLVPAGEDGTRFAWDIIEELVSYGNDTSDERRLFGVYGNVIYYDTIPNTVKYVHKLSDPLQHITDKISGANIFPYDVLPGQWILISDFNAGIAERPAEFRKDPRMKFIESMRYDAPWTVSLMGGKTDKLSQYVQKLTMGGFV
ncbi:MAG TPA: hypothetical protein PLC83_12740 [Anaerolineaceae bacterium]|nr:hypothetical protein [Anaerolineaceae bacterium]